MGLRQYCNNCKTALKRRINYPFGKNQKSVTTVVCRGCNRIFYGKKKK